LTIPVQVVRLPAIKKAQSIGKQHFMFCRVSTVFLLMMALLLGSMHAYAKVTVLDIRLWRAPDNTRVVFDLDSTTTYTLQKLENPSRVLIDIPGGVLALRLDKLNMQNMPIKSIRSLPQPNGALRVELELSEAVNVKHFFLKKNPPLDDRLVVDLIDTVIKEEPSEIDDVVGEKVVRPLQSTGTTLPINNRSPSNPARPIATGEVNKSIQTQTGRRPLIIAIDAGHGGEDPGAIGPMRIREKDVVMEIAKKLQANFNRQLGYKAILIRKSDYFVGLEQRRVIARKANADLFVSIHADAFTKPQANGSSVFALSSSGATSATAQFLADKENQSDLVGGVSLDDKDAVLSSVLVDLSMTYKMESSLEVGALILRKMGNISRLHSTRVEQAAFAVLKTPDIPSVLVETGFISNKAEATKLNTPSYQQRMADAIFHGIHEYFLRKAPEGTYIASTKTVKTDDIVYLVGPGDTLSAIAKKYAVSMQHIIQYNGLRSSNVRIGQKLKIPAR